VTDIDRRDPAGHPLPVPESARQVIYGTATEIPRPDDDRYPVELWQVRTFANLCFVVGLVVVAYSFGWLSGVDLQSFVDHPLDTIGDANQRGLMNPWGLYRGLICAAVLVVVPPVVYVVKKRGAAR
jgi:hypothetical protein